MRTFLLAILFATGLLSCSGAPPRRCAETCLGCCDLSGTCRTGGTVDFCGASGVSCRACAQNQFCQVGSCILINMGGVGGGISGGAAGGAAGGMSGGVAGGLAGGNTAGGNAAGGSTAGGSTAGGVAGGSTAGGGAGGAAGCGTGPACAPGRRCVGNQCVCDSTSCPTGCCSTTGVCTVPSASACNIGGGVCLACGSAGNTCVNGSCQCAGSPSCAVGTTCTATGCACTASSCPNGCCSASRACITSSSVTQCGSGGSACAACGANADTCTVGGTCSCGSNPACGGGLVCVSGACQAAGLTWTQRMLTIPTGVSAASGVWDSARSVLVLFGGRASGGTASADTWQLSSTGWTRLMPATSPPARYGHDVAYDPIRGRVVLFGGFVASGTPRLGDTWEFNGTTWTQVTSAVAPSARSGHRMTWDPVRQHIVLFGGRIDGSTGFYQGDTWSYANGVWALLASTGPSAREGGALVWDPGLSGGRVVTFGGLGANGNRNDTWAWDGTAWTAVSTTASPSGRVFFDLAYHPGLGKVVLFGGSTGGSSGATFNAETWTFDRTTWTQLSTAMSPSARNGQVMEWDPSRMKLLLVGGWNGTSTFDDHWEL